MKTETRISEETAKAISEMDEQIHEGHKIGDLREVFDAIAPKDDWRGEINAMINHRLFPIANAAVEFFTSTSLKVVGGPEPITGHIAVHSVGYRMGPCGS